MTIYRVNIQGMFYQILSGGAIQASNYLTSNVCSFTVEGHHFCPLLKRVMTG